MMFFSSPSPTALTLEYANYLKNLVKQASACDPNRNVFGSSKHNYELYPTVSLEDVRNYEKKHNVHLPSEYVFFITQVGNGGAGPFYGIKPLNLTGRCYLLHSKPAFISSQLTKQQWQNKLAPFLDDDMEDSLYDQIEEEILQGVFELGTQGCTYQIITLMNSPDENRIFYLNDDWNPEYPPYDTKISFLQWYETFFKEIIAGHSVDSYGSLPIASAKELIYQFNQTNNIDIQKQILSSFYRFPTQEKVVLDFFYTLPNPLFATQKLAFLLKYDTKNALQLYSDCLEHFPYSAIKASYAVPKEKLGDFYSDFLKILLYHLPNDTNLSQKELSYYRERLFFRLSNCPQFRCKDIFPFFQQKRLPDEDVCSALYAMEKASDRQTECDAFRPFLLSKSHSVSRYALKVVCTLNCPQLADTYLILWQRYKHDSGMQSLLKTAFQSSNMPIPNDKSPL